MPAFASPVVRPEGGKAVPGTRDPTARLYEDTDSPRRALTLAGAGALVFALLTIVGLALINPPGGTYSASRFWRFRCGPL